MLTGRCSYVLNQILSGKLREEIIEEIQTYLSNLANNVRSGKVPLSSFVITKGLAKAPQNYPNANLPHVQVALRMVQQVRSQPPSSIRRCVC